MSHVTSICVLTDLETEVNEEALESLGFVEVSKHCGGTKATQASIWAAAFNYLESEMELYDKIMRIPFRNKTAVNLLINREEEDGWQDWLPND